jgi:heat shock protein HslJ
MAAACTTDGAALTSAQQLSGTRWQLTEIQPTAGGEAVRPDPATTYTLLLGADSAIEIVLDCRRGTGRWTATPAGAATADGTFGFAPLVVSNQACSPNAMNARVAQELAGVQSYRLEGDRLTLTTGTSTQVWTRVAAN